MLIEIKKVGNDFNIYQNTFMKILCFVFNVVFFM